MVIHGFHVSVSFLNIVFHVSVNVSYGVIKFVYCYISFNSRGRSDNSNSLNGGCWAGAGVCGGRHCEDYILVELVGLLLDN